MGSPQRQHAKTARSILPELLLMSSALTIAVIDDSNESDGKAMLQLEVEEFDVSSLSETDDEDDNDHDGRPRVVGFGNVQVRHYNIVIGDHPLCTEGLPLSLGWNYTSDDDLTLDEYEAQRLPCRKRNRRQLLLSCQEREKLLNYFDEDGNNYAADDEDEESWKREVRHARRKLFRTRNCQQGPEEINSFFLQ